MKKISTILLLSCLAAVTMQAAVSATLRITDSERHQRITGFGGFVCSPQFGYGHMNSSEIAMVWGNNSQLGCNIIRLYLPIGRNAWPSSLATAKAAKQMGLKIFASPWGQPAEWKTNGNSNGKSEDGTQGHLKPEYYADYAQYLEDYVQYLRSNGVELDAISLQNEPDWPSSYAGCVWTPAELAAFVKGYAHLLSVPVMTPETIGMPDSYVDALDNEACLKNFSIYAMHQYGAKDTGFKRMAQRGKEIWMTEFLINWNENQQETRNFSWETDAFDFARAINYCMLNDFNAWIHYSAKRYYGMVGDGQMGTTDGQLTKRGYVMGQFSKFITGYTRIGSLWKDATGQLEGSAYQSQTGDTVVAVIINPASQVYELTVDLPFYAGSARKFVTTAGSATNMRELNVKISKPLCRHKNTIAASSVTTLLYVKSTDRQPSLMASQPIVYDSIDAQQPSQAAYGQAYKMSGRSFTFDHSHFLIGSAANDSRGWLNLNDHYTRLVMHVNSVKSTLNYNSAKNTLYYINDKGQLSQHDYGEIDLIRKQDFDLTFDLSRATLTDGCRAIVALGNNNWSSTLTIGFGDVFLQTGEGSAFRFSGNYTDDDSQLLDCLEDQTTTAIDMTGVHNFDTLGQQPANENMLTYVADGMNMEGKNIVAGTQCKQLQLSAQGGNFRVLHPFTTLEARMQCRITGARMLLLPFNAAVPEGVKAYRIAYGSGDSMTAEPIETIAAGEPALVMGNGMFTFEGSGTVDSPAKPGDEHFRGTFSAIPLGAGCYVLRQQNGQWGFARLEENATLSPFDAWLLPDASSESFLPVSVNVTVEAVDDARQTGLTGGTAAPCCDLLGRSGGIMGRNAGWMNCGVLLVKAPDGRFCKQIQK